MTITEIAPDYSVAPQIAPADVAEIAGRGFSRSCATAPTTRAPIRPTPR